MIENIVSGLALAAAVVAGVVLLILAVFGWEEEDGGK